MGEWVSGYVRRGVEEVEECDRQFAGWMVRGPNIGISEYRNIGVN